MIPKIIHYCWFGGNPLPKSAEKCINSWKKFFPDYEIKEWNENNFDVKMNGYVKFCYEHKLWAYLSDYVRLFVVEHEGGLYFDTDVEVVRYPEELIENSSAWFGFENSELINTGLGFAAEAHHPAVKAMLEEYVGRCDENMLMIELEKGKIAGCPGLNTKALLKHGLKLGGELQCVCKAEILPMEWLCPFNDVTGEIKKTLNTVSIHWFSKSPHGKMAWWRSQVTRPLHRWFGVNCLMWLKINK